MTPNGNANGNTDSRTRTTSRRRRFLQGIGATGFAGVFAGCLGGDDADDADDTDDTDDDTADDTDESEPAFFEVSDLDPEAISVSWGSSIEVSATITNTGDEDATRDIELLLDGESEGVQEVGLGGGESEHVTFEDIETEPLEFGDSSYEVTSGDDEATGTLTVEAILGDDPDGLLSFDTDVLTFATGTNTAVATLENSYSIDLESGNVDIGAPDGWEVTAEDGTDFDTLEAGESQAAEWEIDVPGDADGEYTLDFDVSYETEREEADVSVTQAVTISEPMSAPFGMDCGGAHTDETVDIDGLVFLPEAEVAQGIEMDMENRTLTEEEIWWPETVTVSPDPESNAETYNSEWEPFADIDGTEHDALYQTEHWANGELSYAFFIENGTYDVTLHFAELVQTSAGERVFSASINGDSVFEDLDMYDEYGPITAITYTQTVTVDNNQLAVEFESSVENPKISGIEIRDAE